MTQPRGPTRQVSCEGKKAYTKDEAEWVRNRLKKSLNVYRCHFCHAFHLGGRVTNQLTKRPKPPLEENDSVIFGDYRRRRG